MKYKRISHPLLFLILILAACQKGVPTPHIDPAQSSATSEVSSTSATTAETSSRQAVITEVLNNVTVQLIDGSNKIPAEIGITLQVGNGLETGNDGHARIDLKPEGTIVRVGPNSFFSLPELADANGQPKTTLKLLFGKIFVLLKGGSLDVQTASGTASVRGSLLSVEYDPEKGVILAGCLEGHCGLENENGEEVELEEGQSSYIEGDNAPAEPEEIDRQDVQDWLEENPDLQDFIDQLPDPQDFPDYETPLDSSDNASDQNLEPASTEAPVDDGSSGDSDPTSP